MKILYFDDSHYLYQSIYKYCRASAFVVDIVSTVRQAYYHFKTTFYDVLVVDLQADFGAGLDFIEKIRKENLVLPIIVTAKNVGWDTKLRLLENFVDDYLEKPFAWEEMMARVKSVTRRGMGRGAREAGFSFDYGPVKLDEKTFTVNIYGKLIELCQKEFMILKYLLDNYDHVVTREELFFNLWDANADVFSNSLNVHLANLRKKINVLPVEKPLIKTLRGRGIKFCLPDLALCEANG